MQYCIGIDEVGRAASKRRASPRYIIGIDEVGRGSLAGPVVVAAVAIPKGLVVRNRELGKLRDSKKLSAKQRERWSAVFLSHAKLRYALARVYPRQIEKRNISRAANLAAERAHARLVKSFNIGSYKVFLDGGLYLGNGDQPKNAKTIVKGDEKIKTVAAASILAKVSRDGLMKRLAKKYPKYGFEVHKGYGTMAHMRAIKKYGPSEVHRRTFIS